MLHRGQEESEPTTLLGLTLYYFWIISFLSSHISAWCPRLQQAKAQRWIVHPGHGGFDQKVSVSPHIVSKYICYSFSVNMSIVSLSTVKSSQGTFRFLYHIMSLNIIRIIL